MTAFQPGDRVHLKGHAHAPATLGTVIGQTLGGRLFVQWDDGHAITPHLPQHLEPAGEPMQTDSNTFKHKDTITQVYALAPGELAVNTFGDRYDVKGTQALVDAKDAPALALAVLDAPASNGAPVAPEVARAIAALEEYKQRTQAEAEDAADREALEGEAYALYRASCLACNTTPAPDWATAKVLTDYVERDFIAIAVTARELHGVTK